MAAGEKPISMPVLPSTMVIVQKLGALNEDNGDFAGLPADRLRLTG